MLQFLSKNVYKIYFYSTKNCHWWHWRFTAQIILDKKRTILLQSLITLFKFLGAKLFTNTSWDICTYSSKVIFLSPFLSPMPINPSTKFSNCRGLKFRIEISSETLLASINSSFVKYLLLSVLTKTKLTCSAYQGCLWCNLRKITNSRVFVYKTGRDLVKVSCWSAEFW